MAVILPSVYKDGTATIAANGTAVTGQNTLWVNSVLPGDFFGVHKGYAVRIATVNSNTSLTLANPWPGTAQTTAAYEIMLQSDNARMQETSRQLLQALSNGNIASLGNLTTAADTLAYYNGPGTSALTPFTSFGRSLVGTLNASAAYGVLGTIPNAQLPTRLREFSTAVTDANAATSFGSYAVAANAANIPEAAVGTLLVVPQTTGALTAQTYTRTSSGAVWKRTQTASETWTAWRKIPFAQTALTDTASDAAMLVGAFGLGGVGTNLDTTANLDTLPAITSFYRWGSSTKPANAPDTGTSIMLHMQFGSGGAAQIVFSLSSSGSVIVSRKQASATWTSWTRIDGDVRGPESSTDGQFAQFSGTTGKLIKAASIPTASILGRATAGSGNVENLTAAQAAQILGGWEPIAFLNLSGVTVSAITNLSAFVMLRCSFNYSLASAGSCFIQVSTNNGSSYRSAATDYWYSLVQNRYDGSSIVAGGEGDITGISLGDDIASGHVMIGAFNKARAAHAVSHQMIETATERNTRLINTKINGTAARNAIRIFSGGGNITGQFLLEGVRG